MSTAFVFPGQGSQSVGMLEALADEFTLVGDTFAEASEALGYDLWQLVQNGPDSELNATQVTQPAMLSSGVAVWRVWQEKGGATPALMAGHSLGEYSALVCAGSLDFAEAVSVVADRGRFMQEAVPEGKGAMAAVLGLDDETVTGVCAEAAQGSIVASVNFNSPGQVVIAGEKEAVERAISLAKDKGARRAMLLPVSVPSHCDLMIPAAERLRERLQEITIRPPDIPVIHNVDVSSHQSAEEIITALAEQLYRPVRWVETVQTLEQQGADTIIECGPGKVLAGLCKRIDRSIAAAPVFDGKTLEAALE